jgi:DhnA family fructose-bisphosphate aldolase class Ia
MARVLSTATPSFIFPIDDALLSGPTGSIDDPREIVRSVVQAGASSVLCFPGAFRWCINEIGPAGYIQNISASTTMSHHTQKVLVSQVDDAVRNGADCVGVHINYSADTEPAMLAQVGHIAEECRAAGMPLLAISYPRRQASDDRDDNYQTLRSDDQEKYTQLVIHCARASAELGANIVKVPYTGSTESFAQVVKSAIGAAVIVAGGPPVTDERAIEIAVEAISAGAAGVAYGRQTFLKPAEDAGRFISRLLDAMQNVARTAEASLIR